MWAATEHSLGENNRNNTGFTIVELLIVIVVLGILVATTAVAYRGMQQRATTASITAAVDQWEKLIRMEIIKTGSFTNLVGACLGRSAADFPQRGDFAAGDCVNVWDGSGIALSLGYEDGGATFSDSTTLPSGLLPQTSFKIDASSRLQARGVWVYSADDGVRVTIAWVPQVAKQCGRGVTILETSEDMLGGGYCSLSIEY